MEMGRLRMVIMALAICTMFLLGSACGKKALSDEEAYKRFVGRWVNTDYPGTLIQSQITVIRPDYVGEDWLFPDSTSPDGQWTIKVKKTWVDEKGSTYCQFFFNYIKGSDWRGAAIMRVDKAGKVWELNSRGASREDSAVYPEEIDPLGRPYYIYYRK